MIIIIIKIIITIIINDEVVQYYLASNISFVYRKVFLCLMLRSGCKQWLKETVC